jgi:hypothetical protein
MKLPTRYGIAGIAALAALSVIHWLRGIEFPRHEVSSYLLGVLPNLCAAVAITFVVLSIWADQQKLFEYQNAKRWFWIAASIAGVGLIGWELAQLTMSSFVFDINDMGATFAGLVLSGAVFYLVTPRTARSAGP